MLKNKKKTVKNKKIRNQKKDRNQTESRSIKEETLRGIWGVLLTVTAMIFLFAPFNTAGKVGAFIYSAFSGLFGIGYYLIPISLILFSVALFRSIGMIKEKKMGVVQTAGSLLFFISSLALLETVFENAGGFIGSLIATPLIDWLAIPSTVLILLALIAISLMIVFDTHPKLRIPFVKNNKSDSVTSEIARNNYETVDEASVQKNQDQKKDIKINMPLAKQDQETSEKQKNKLAPSKNIFKISKPSLKNENIDKEISLTVNSVSEGDYTPPPLTLLRKNSGRPVVGDVKANATLIKRTLKNFGIDVEMDEVSIGPTVTRYALKPAEGVKLGKILGLQSNLELALAASPVRIEAPIPGKALVGIEVPNSTRTVLGLGSMFTRPEYINSDKPLLVALGSDISGKPHFADIAKMPHMLIAGATGAGKSVTMNNLIISLLYRSGPQKLRLLMVDPKRVELTLYNKIPHLLTPVITDAKKAILALKWLAKEMDRRYDVLQEVAVRDISSYHKNIVMPAKKRKLEGKLKKDEKMPEDMPYIVAFLDEISDLMQAYPRELEAAIVRLTQMSRAVGIHLILATQRPSVKVITGLIKANVPTRLALQVASQVDSRTILDVGGAEKLLGAGDMLYLGGDMSKPIRVQAPFVSEDEVKKVVRYLRKSYETELDDEIDLNEGSDPSIFEASIFDASSANEDEDELFEEAKRVIMEAGKGSTSYLQRKLRIGYARAARLMDMLEERGIVGPAEGSKPREVIIPTNGDDDVNEDDKL